MKEFFKMMFACLAALVLAGGAMLFFTLVILGGLAAAASGDPTALVPRDAFLVMDVSTNIIDAPGGDPTEALLSGALGEYAPPRLQLRKVIAALDRAADDDRIQGLLLHGTFEAAGLGTGYGALLEVRTALERFRAAGKPVIAYLVTPSTRDYMVASTADRVILHPMGRLVMPGLNAEVIYWGGLFARYGVGVQVARAGEFKSGAETFVRENMSENERSQLTELLDDIWAEFLASVSRSRNLDEGVLQRVIDEQGLIAAEDAKAAGLVDELRVFSDVLDELRAKTGVDDPTKPFKQVSLARYIAAHDLQVGRRPVQDHVAVVYAEGEIIDGEGAPGMVGGDRLARELRKLRHDEKVKAVVLRINSPGGSAIASEVIRSELVLLNEAKPVVVSMGSFAASGGYWIATAGDRIFAEPTTVTGSIGVYAVLPNIEGLTERFGVNIEGVKTGRHADVFSIARPRSPETMQVVQAAIDATYEAFITRVAEGRNMDRAEVERVAQGHVWSGSDALRHGLVDEIGGLDRAIENAASMAHLEEYSVIDYPEAKDFLTRLLEQLSGYRPPLAARHRGAAGEMHRWLEQVEALANTFHDRSGIYARLPMFLRIN